MQAKIEYFLTLTLSNYCRYCRHPYICLHFSVETANFHYAVARSTNQQFVAGRIPSKNMTGPLDWTLAFLLARNKSLID